MVLQGPGERIPSGPLIVRLLRADEPAADYGAMPPWESARGFVLAVRESVALDAAAIYALGAPDVQRAEPALHDEFAVLARALGRALTPGVALPIDHSTRVGQDPDPTAVRKARTPLAMLPTSVPTVNAPLRSWCSRDGRSPSGRRAVFDRFLRTQVAAPERLGRPRTSSDAHRRP